MSRKTNTRHAKKTSKKSAKKLTKFQTALIRLRNLPRGKQQQAMSMANNKFIDQFCSHVKRLKYAKLNARQRKLLRKQRAKLQSLIKKRTTIQRKPQILSQRGGFIPFLLPLLASVVAPALAAAIGKAVNR